MDGAIHIAMDFVLARPRTVTRPHPTVPPDLDKLIRAVLDGLTAIAYRDDAQVTSIKASKRYGQDIGVHITIEKDDTTHP